MPEISLGLSAYDRKTTWASQIRVVNYLAEKAPSNGFTGLNHVQRPGLAPFSSVGTGPIRGMLRQAGTFDGDLMAVSDEQLYRVDSDGNGSLVGDLPGQLRTTAAATRVRMIFVSDGIAYSTDGSTIVQVNMPDGRPVGSVAQLNGYFILTEFGTARVYYIEPGEVEPDGFDYFTTESSPGDNVRAVRIGDEIWFLKEEGAEVWQPTGDADIPFQRVPGRNYDKGCRNADTAVLFDNSLAWVGQDGIVYRGAETPVRISTNSEEEKIRKADPFSLRSWSFETDGHALLVVNTSLGTIVYDASTQAWSEFSSWERPYWRAHVGEVMDTFTVAGDDELGLIYMLDQERSNDNGAPMERILTGGIPVAGGSQACDNIALYVTTGTATDPNLAPEMTVRWSDNGRTYGDPRYLSLNPQGQYGEPVRTNRLGVMRYPGRLFEFAITADVVATISGAAYNTPLR